MGIVGHEVTREGGHGLGNWCKLRPKGLGYSKATTQCTSTSACTCTLYG